MKKAISARGFTLIEMLTVIVIIAVLASMLFTVFQKARESARKRRCLSEVRELSKAWYAYWKAFGETEFPQGIVVMDAGAVASLQGANSKSTKFMDFPPSAEVDGFRDPWGNLYRVELILEDMDADNVVTYRTKAFLVNKSAYDHE